MYIPSLKKGPENFEKSKTRKNNRQNSENMIFVKKKRIYVKSIQRAIYVLKKIEEFILINETVIAKK